MKKPCRHYPRRDPSSSGSTVTAQGLSIPPSKKSGKAAPGKKPSKKIKAEPTESDEVEADIDGHAVMLTEKQSAFITALGQADDCVSRTQAQKILGKSDPVFYGTLKDLKARIGKVGFEITTYQGKGYRLEKAEPA
jgi:hypothetical protein